MNGFAPGVEGLSAGFAISNPAESPLSICVALLRAEKFLGVLLLYLMVRTAEVFAAVRAGVDSSAYQSVGGAPVTAKANG